MLSLLSLAVYREVEPFSRPATNTLVYIAQYGILLTYAGALAIETDIAKNVDNFAFGMFLLAANLVVLVVAAGIAATRHAIVGRWLHRIDDDDAWVLDAVKNGVFDAGDSAAGEAGLEFTFSAAKSSCSSAVRGISDNTELLRQFIIDARGVNLDRRVGAGAFGEVFAGTCLGQPVAIKTLKHANSETARALRAEVLLTASLRHPNVVSFVGACWEQELTCLILEWLPRGSLGGLLKASGASLRWEEPLLRLATDVARGMAYLHAREFFNEVTGELERCIVHR